MSEDQDREIGSLLREKMRLERDLRTLKDSMCGFRDAAGLAAGTIAEALADVDSGLTPTLPEFSTKGMRERGDFFGLLDEIRKDAESLRSVREKLGKLLSASPDDVAEVAFEVAR